METLFKEFFAKHPMKFSESIVIKQIKKCLEQAQKCYKKEKESGTHVKYMVSCYRMLEDYFREKGIDPDAY